MDCSIETLERLSDALGGYGVRCVSVGDRELAYVNLGDTYTETLAVEGGDLLITSWGAWHEQAEQEHCDNEDVIRCGYCGEFTENTLRTGDVVDWHMIVCEHCGEHVGG